MNTELLEALNMLEKEKEISKETLLDAIENSLLNACKNHLVKQITSKLLWIMILVIISFLQRRQLLRL